MDIKEFQSWKYSDNICVKCKKHEETINHFVSCPSYETDIENNWEDVNGDNFERQIEIARIVEKRIKVRQKILDKQEDGQASNHSGSSCSDSP